MGRQTKPVEPDSSGMPVPADSRLKPSAESFAQFVKKDRALKIIKEMSEFLRILDLRESEILKTMIVRFAIESVEASQGSLLVWDETKGALKYQNTFLYDANNKIILDTTVFENYNELMDIHIKGGEGIAGEAFKSGISVLVEDIENSPYAKPIVSEVMKLEVFSVIAIPLKINNEIAGVLEITNTKDKPSFTDDDLETITIIANFASAILENANLFLWAIHDSLTGLYNSHYFYKELGDEIEKSKRYGRVFSLVLFDIDNFKLVNDTYGHSSGDRALVMLANAIRKTIRKDVDIASRYGGDEFMMAFPNTNAENAYKVCERLLSMVRKESVATQDGKTFNITLSIGITEYPADGAETYFLFNKADEALYTSKRGGKNRITVFKRP